MVAVLAVQAAGAAPTTPRLEASPCPVRLRTPRRLPMNADQAGVRREIPRRTPPTNRPRATRTARRPPVVMVAGATAGRRARADPPRTRLTDRPPGVPGGRF